ncbi:hypothetical protein [Candidatus Tokpelaia sp.]|uniref:hypothetical protein n=1 Tax=Candidatus Tokpelaia sp. TaxID=2233777 RepID=UPI0012394DA0|nr:hypothetical protein [Candidatus Tokpelaia sp.]KAA6405053.1 hypothetical protein DPQ22_05675 [Candidatus Tokpelaia sp.]
MKIVSSVDEYVLVEGIAGDRLEWRFFNCLTGQEWAGTIAGRDCSEAFFAAMKARGLPSNQNVLTTSPIPRINVYLPANYCFDRRLPKSGRAQPQEVQNASV